MQTSLKHRELTKAIIGLFYDVYNELGHGFIESVYHKAFLLALEDAGLKATSKVKLPVSFRSKNVGDFEADLVVDRKIIIELKASRALVRANEAQLLNYLRATDIEIGILFNFGEKPEFKRLAFDNSRKVSRQNSIIEALFENEFEDHKNAANP